MYRQTHRNWLSRGAWIAALALSMLIFAGCALGGPGATSASATSSPTATTAPLATAVPLVAPQAHVISLGGYKASLALPGAAGLALDPAAPSNSGGMRSLSFYSYSAQAVRQIATAPTEADGTTGGILGSAYGGDWVSYVTDDQHKTNWTLWAYNVATAERVQVDSEAQEGVTAPWTGPWVTTGADLVWSVISHDTSGQTISMLKDFSYATRQTQTLYTATGLLATPLAMNDNAVLLEEADNSGAASTYLLRRGASTPTQISKQIAGNAWMSSHYAVWDNAHSQTTTLYNLATGAEIDNWAPFIRPAIAESQPYVVCVQFATTSNMLVHVPDGQSVAIDAGHANLGGGGQIYNGRAFFIAQSGDVEYFALPAQ